MGSVKNAGLCVAVSTMKAGRWREVVLCNRSQDRGDFGSCNLDWVAFSPMQIIGALPGLLRMRIDRIPHVQHYHVNEER